MQFTRQNNLYQVSRVTGPTHNFLSVSFVNGAAAVPQVEALPSFCHGHTELDPDLILASVQVGLAFANQQLGTDYGISHIQYRLGDNPPEVVYSFLTLKIVEHLVSGGEFMAAVLPGTSLVAA